MLSSDGLRGNVEDGKDAGKKTWKKLGCYVKENGFIKFKDNLFDLIGGFVDPVVLYQACEKG